MPKDTPYNDTPTYLRVEISFVNGINLTNHSTNQERPCTTTQFIGAQVAQQLGFLAPEPARDFGHLCQLFGGRRAVKGGERASSFEDSSGATAAAPPGASIRWACRG
ncbi:hypothetical protein DIPPA_10126 [Diplonema papillatum]|nr:hypothetical protein DIPPA_10126 [Diplonema papillatum]